MDSWQCCSEGMSQSSSEPAMQACHSRPTREKHISSIVKCTTKYNTHFTDNSQLMLKLSTAHTS